MDTATLCLTETIFRTGSIREAGRIEGRAPATVSAALARLEASLAVPLMRREGGSLVLTLEAQNRLAALGEIVEAVRALLEPAGQADRAAAIAINIATLTRFSAAAHTGSIRSAARGLGLGQPQLTRQLSELESRLGYALLERTRNGVSCTELGLRALPLAERVIAGWEAMSAASTARFRRNMATWRLATVVALGHESAIAKRLAHLAAAWRLKHPRQPLFISAGNADELIAGLKARRHDAALIDHADYPREFEGCVISDTPLALVGSVESMAGFSAADFAKLLRQRPLALPSQQNGLRQHASRFLDEILDDREQREIGLVEVDSIPVIINLVARHGFLSILPQAVLSRLPFALSSIALGPDHRQILTLIWRGHALPDDVSRDLVALLQAGDAEDQVSGM